MAKTKKTKSTAKKVAPKKETPVIEDDLTKQKKSLEQLDVSDGKDRNQEDIEKARKLEALLGVPAINPYGTYKKEIFEQNLEHMTRADMMALASRVGVIPTRDRIRIKKDLMKSFEMFAHKANVNVPSPPRPAISKGDKNYKKKIKLFED